MSLANFTTLYGLPLASKTGLYEAWIQISLPLLVTRLNSSETKRPMASSCQKRAYSTLCDVRRVDEHAVMAPLDLVERVAEQAEEVVVGGEDGAVEGELDLGERAVEGGEQLLHPRELLLRAVVADDDGALRLAPCGRARGCRSWS